MHILILNVIFLCVSSFKSRIQTRARFDIFGSWLRHIRIVLTPGFSENSTWRSTINARYCFIMNCFQRIFFRRKKDGRPTKEKLPVKQKFSHGVGHILNDLAASVWFSYLLIYLTKVAGLSNRNSGLVVLLGQIADALFTPFIGILCDRTVCRYGRRKLWHLIGTILTSVSFPMLFIRLLPEDSASLLKLTYFVGVAAVFQFGWGSVQISHLSLIPEICHRNNERVELNAIRSVIRTYVYILILLCMVLFKFFSSCQSCLTMLA